MKKLVISTICALLFLNAGAQSFLEAYENTRHFEPFANANGTQSYDALTGNPGEWSKVMGVFYQFDDIQFGKRGVDGTAYLYDSWSNKGAVYLGKKVFKLNNINYHIEQSIFLTKIENDSLFVFDFDLVDKIEVNNRTFKRMYNSKEGKHIVYEIVHKNKDFSLLKQHSLSVVKSSPNPMVNRPKPKIRRAANYYVSKAGVIQSFKLKKSAVLALLDSDTSKSFKAYMDRYNLSYKNETDLQKAFINVL